MGAPRGTVAERFARHWKLNPANGCHEWQGAMDTKGYGQLNVDGRTRTATQISLELDGRPRPDPSMCALHRCDNPACVNPAHLWWGSRKENHQDALNKGRLYLDGLALGREVRARTMSRQPVVPCDHCGTAFKTSSARVAMNRKNYCSRVCCIAAQRIERRRA